MYNVFGAVLRTEKLTIYGAGTILEKSGTKLVTKNLFKMDYLKGDSSQPFSEATISTELFLV